MFRSVSDCATLWETILPPAAMRLPEKMVKANVLLAEVNLVEVFRRYFSPDLGRKSTPMDVFVRLMYLKFDRKIGYEQLVDDVNGSLRDRLFCRIGIGQVVPHHSTLKGLVKRCGPDAIEALNKVVVAVADKRGAVDVSKVRTDTTLIDANIAYPTDSGLLTKAIKTLVGSAKKLTNTLDLGVRVEDTTDEVKDLNRRIGQLAKSRQEDRKDQILVLTDNLADLAAQAGSQAVAVVEAATAALEARQRGPEGRTSLPERDREGA